jgi:hypothetical protein
MKVHYQEFLGLVGTYGYGVFTNNQLDDMDQQAALGMFIKRHPELFRSYPARPGDLVIRQLTKEGLKHFGATGRLSKSENWYSLLDLLLVNSYMNEWNCWGSYSGRPQQVHMINGKAVGILSMRWGLPPGVKDTEILLTTPHYQTILQAQGLTIHPDLERKIYIPIALRSVRKSLL